MTVGIVTSRRRCLRRMTSRCEDCPPTGNFLARLPAVEWQDEAPPAAALAIEFSWAGETARRVGTVVHRWLQRIGEDALSGWNAERVQAIAPRIQRELAAFGISGDDLKAASSRVAQALTSAVTEQRARWVLGPHSAARSELRLTVYARGHSEANRARSHVRRRAGSALDH